MQKEEMGKKWKAEKGRSKKGQDEHKQRDNTRGLKWAINKEI